MSKQKPIILFHTEEFKFEKVKAEGEDEKETIIISGNAQPLNEDSRNGVRYRPKSVKAKYKTMMGNAYLNSHDPTKSLGHVVDVGLTDTHMTYKVDVDPNETEYIHKVERGDIRHVSVGCLVENVSFNEEDNIYECDVKEYLELSAVTVAGFGNTSATKEGAIYLAEKLGDEKVLEKLKAEAKECAPSKGEYNLDSKVKDIQTASKTEDDDEGDKEKEADDEDDKEDEGEDDDKDSDDSDEEEADSDDDKDKDKDDSKEAEDDDEDKDKDESDDDSDDDKEESLNKKLKEDAGTSEDEKTAEERISDLESKNQELESKIEEFDNRLAIAESKVDAMNDNDENLENDSEEISPDTSENFKDKKPSVRTKQELNAKEKALFGENTNKINESKEVVDMNELRLKNMSK